MTVHSQEPWQEAAQRVAIMAAVKGHFKRDRQARWDASHIRTASCRLKVEEMQQLKEACREQKVTVYGLLRYMIMLYLKIQGRE